MSETGIFIERLISWVTSSYIWIMHFKKPLLADFSCMKDNGGLSIC